MGRPRIDWASLVSEYERSGMSRAEFCRIKGVSASSFGVWYKRLHEMVETQGVVVITEKGVAAKGMARRQSSCSNERIVMRIGSAVPLELPDNFNQTTLRRVIEALGCWGHYHQGIRS